jgi:hypothetical protein
VGFRFRRRIKLFPGLWLNASKSGLSASVGGPGATLNIGGKGGPRTTVGIPGTGVSYTEPLSPPSEGKPASGAWRAAGWILLCIVVVLIVLAAGCTTAAPAGKPQFACYDVRGRLADGVTNKGECDARDWEWRERP